MKEYDNEPKSTAKMVNLGTCEICGQPILVAASIAKICPVPITTCSRECGEKAAQGEASA